MSSVAFNIADVIKESGPKPPKSKLQEIELHLIDKNPQNFYSMEGINELADSIALVGLLDPLLVKENTAGRYMLVSGHRRREALRKLAEEGFFEDGMHHKVDCIVTYAPEELPGITDPNKIEEAFGLIDHLRLILANSDTRKKSSADTAMEARELKNTITRLKTLGYELPRGRTRKLVADTMNISATRIARLETIDKNLQEPALRKAWEDGTLGETSAYEIARRSPEIQRLVKDRVGIRPLCGMKTESVVICLDGCEADGSRKRPEPEKVSAADTMPNPQPANAEERYAAWQEASAMEDNILRDICRRNLGSILDTIMRHRSQHDFSTCFRLQNIDAMKRRGTGSYTFRWDGDDEYVEWDSSRVKVRKLMEEGDSRSWVSFNRSWTDFYDALSGAAMEQARKKKPEKVSAADTISAASPTWSTGTPAEPGEYLVIYGITKDEDAMTRSCRIMKWDGFGFVNPKSGVANLEGMNIYRWVQM